MHKNNSWIHNLARHSEKINISKNVEVVSREFNIIDPDAMAKELIDKVRSVTLTVQDSIIDHNSQRLLLIYWTKTLETILEKPIKEDDNAVGSKEFTAYTKILREINDEIKADKLEEAEKLSKKFLDDAISGKIPKSPKKEELSDVLEEEEEEVLEKTDVGDLAKVKGSLKFTFNPNYLDSLYFKVTDVSFKSKLAKLRPTSSYSTFTKAHIGKDNFIVTLYKDATIDKDVPLGDIIHIQKDASTDSWMVLDLGNKSQEVFNKVCRRLTVYPDDLGSDEFGNIAKVSKIVTMFFDTPEEAAKYQELTKKQPEIKKEKEKKEPAKKEEKPTLPPKAEERKEPKELPDEKELDKALEELKKAKPASEKKEALSFAEYQSQKQPPKTSSQIKLSALDKNATTITFYDDRKFVTTIQYHPTTARYCITWTNCDWRSDLDEPAVIEYLKNDGVTDEEVVKIIEKAKKKDGEIDLVKKEKKDKIETKASLDIIKAKFPKLATIVLSPEQLSRLSALSQKEGGDAYLIGYLASIAGKESFEEALEYAEKAVGIKAAVSIKEEIKTLDADTKKIQQATEEIKNLPDIKSSIENGQDVGPAKDDLYTNKQPAHGADIEIVVEKDAEEKEEDVEKVAALTIQLPQMQVKPAIKILEHAGLHPRLVSQNQVAISDDESERALVLLADVGIDLQVPGLPGKMTPEEAVQMTTASDLKLSVIDKEGNVNPAVDPTTEEMKVATIFKNEPKKLEYFNNLVKENKDLLLPEDIKEYEALVEKAHQSPQNLGTWVLLSMKAMDLFSKMDVEAPKE